MNTLKKKIYIKQWLDLKPYYNQMPTDGYYLKICNEVKQSIIARDQSSILQTYLESNEIDELSCFLTSYFEDLISDTNIWNTFIKLHQKLYGKQLPFYETDNYYEHEINLADICFLIWYFINTIHEDIFIFPINNFLIEISDSIMQVFEDAWEYAPENEQLKTFYTIDEEETDFYIARNLIDAILFKSYLFYPDSFMTLAYSELEIIEKHKNNEHIIDYLNDNRDNKIYKIYTRLLGLKSQEWIAAILGDNHKLSKEFLKMSQKIRGYFFYKGQDKENIYLEHIASGMKFNLTKKSFDNYDSLKDIDTILFLGIAKWRDEWWFSGVFFQAEYNPDLILDEKNSTESRNAVNFLDQEDMKEHLDNQFKAFKEYNNNQPIAFMESDKIEPFIKNYIDFFNNSLNLSQKEKDEALQRARNQGFFVDRQETKDPSSSTESGLVFFNHKSGIEIALSVNSAFPMKGNPFYNSEESDEHIKNLLFSEQLSTELTMFCIDNFKNELDFFKTPEGKLYLNDIDFLLRFWKRGNYFAIPTITITGK